MCLPYHDTLLLGYYLLCAKMPTTRLEQTGRQDITCRPTYFLAASAKSSRTVRNSISLSAKTCLFSLRTTSTQRATRDPIATQTTTATGTTSAYTAQRSNGLPAGGRQLSSAGGVARRVYAQTVRAARTHAQQVLPIPPCTSQHVHTHCSRGVVAFRLIAPPVGSTAEPQPKSN